MCESVWARGKARGGTRGRGGLAFLLVFSGMVLLPLGSVSAQRIIDLGEISRERKSGTGGVDQFNKGLDLNTEVWVSDIGPRPTVSDAELVASLYDRARDNISGMLYGYDFVYKPANPERGIGEEFTLELLARLDDGDRLFRVITIWKEAEEVHGLFTYRATGNQLQWLSAWKNSPSITSGGRGDEAVWGGNADEESLSQQEGAVSDALLNAVSRYVDKKYRGAVPRVVEGKLLLLDSPRVWTRDGEYRAELFTRIRIDRVEEFLVN